MVRRQADFDPFRHGHAGAAQAGTMMSALVPAKLPRQRALRRGANSAASLSPPGGTSTVSHHRMFSNRPSGTTARPSARQRSSASDRPSSRAARHARRPRW